MTVSIYRMRDNEISRNWGWFAQLIMPALVKDTSRTVQQLRTMIQSGDCQAWTLHGNASAVAVTSLGRAKDGQNLTMWVLYIAGKAVGGPKRRLATMRYAMQTIKDAAKALGASEVRMEDRKAWASVFPDFTVSTKENGGIVMKGAI